MGYRKLSDGTWEQPAQAAARVLRRKAAAIFLSGATLIGGLVGAGYGAYEMVTSNVAQRQEQTDHDKLLGGFLITLFGAAVAASSALGMSVLTTKDNNSLDKIRRDIKDGVKVVDGQRVLPDYMTGQVEPNQVRQPV